ncbi:hypothetical protein BJ944DRAFT_258916 [Cunninghamella echinulata]|nr:hypothetical protein BJ944DRAFT_258916 [Cunninghamella echinulata]
MDEHGWSTTPQMGQVIFSAGSKKKHDEFWDDQELIDHWEATKEIYKKHHSKLKNEDSPPPFSANKKHQKKRKLTSNQKSPKKRKSNQTKDDFIYTHIPPPPPPPPPPPSFSIPFSYQHHTDASISQLIHAWYLYGYYNGYQAGKSLNHQVKSNKNEK